MTSSCVIVEPVATDQTVRSAEFQEIDVIAERLPELFVADSPTGRHSGEELEPVTGCQTFRAVVAEVELDEISLVKVVGGAARETLIALRERPVGAKFAHHVHEERSDVVLVEPAAVVQAGVEIEGLVGVGFSV